MAHDLMFQCERRTLYKRDGVKVQGWKAVKVADLDASVTSRDLRCAYCNGRVRLHRQRVAHGPADHVEHYSRHDSEGCPGGIYFQGTPRLSATPV